MKDTNTLPTQPAEGGEASEQLKRAVDLLDAYLGDSDPMILNDLTPEEIATDFPVVAAMQILVGLMTPALPMDSQPVAQTLTPEWLWSELMDYCRKQGTAPANNPRLFEIVTHARSFLATQSERGADHE